MRPQDNDRFRWPAVVRWAFWIWVILQVKSGHAADWLCMEEAAIQKNNIVNQCGVAVGRTEGAARLGALRYALSEFKLICDASSDCYGHNIYTRPTRSTCQKEPDGQYKCFRMIEVTIGDLFKP